MPLNGGEKTKPTQHLLYSCVVLITYMWHWAIFLSVVIFLASTASHTLAQSVTIIMLQGHLKHKGGQRRKNNDGHDTIHTDFIFAGHTRTHTIFVTLSQIKTQTQIHRNNRTKTISANPSPPFLKHTLAPLLYVPVCIRKRWHSTS